MLLEQKTAVIYGAGGAIGSAVARAFAREGARVFLAGRTRPPLDALAREIAQAGGVAQAASVDALDTRAVEEHLNAIVAQTGRIDISFNAIASKADQGDPLVEMSVDAFTLGIIDAMQTQFVTSTAAARHMLTAGSGVILAITATPARMFVPNTGNFGVTGAAIERLCRQMAGELGPRGIRVVCLRSAGSPDAPWWTGHAPSGPAGWRFSGNIRGPVGRANAAETDAQAGRSGEYGGADGVGSRKRDDRRGRQCDLW